MKRIIKILVSLMLASFLILQGSCEGDLMQDPINNSLPEIKTIEAEESLLLINDSTQVAVQANNASSYSWSATAGSFVDANVNPAIYVAGSEGAPVSVTCTVSNKDGSQKASMTISVVTAKAPEGAAAYWPFDNDLNELVTGTGADVGAEPSMVSISEDAKIGNGAALFNGTDLTFDGALYYDLDDVRMDEGEEWTYLLWLKNEEQDLGFLFGMSFEGEYVEGAKGAYVDAGALNFDVSWVDGTGIDATLNDNVWHHLAISKGEANGLKIYIDGVLEGEAPDIGWSSSEGTVTTIGTAIEDPGYGPWPGVYQGLIDDIIFFNRELDESEIQDFYNSAE
jgi:hypothetical protein